jgi:hypothetical protein
MHPDEISDAEIEAARTGFSRSNGTTEKEWWSDALAAFLAARWRPIETAPHDGSWHLVISRCAGVPFAARRGPGSQIFEGFIGGDSWDDITHWQPLPLPPGKDAS